MEVIGSYSSRKLLRLVLRNETEQDTRQSPGCFEPSKNVKYAAWNDGNVHFRKKFCKFFILLTIKKFLCFCET